MHQDGDIRFADDQWQRYNGGEWQAIGPPAADGTAWTSVQVEFNASYPIAVDPDEGAR